MTATPIHDEMAEVEGGPGDQEAWVADDAERVVALAWQEAHALGHRCFGTGHLLLGVVRAEGPEAGLLAAAGITARTAGAAPELVARYSASEPVEVVRGTPPQPGPSVGEVLADACRFAASEGHAAVGAAELLGALLARPWGQAAEMLAALGVPVDELGDAARAVGRTAAVPSARPATWRDPSRLLTRAHRPAPAEPAPAEPAPV